MANAYQIQIQRVVVDSNCKRQLVNFGDALIIEAKDERTALRTAARQKLYKKHDEHGPYHEFLMAQAHPELSFTNRHMPYQWFILKGKTTWSVAC